ncbi:hypothetical protein Acy02nite_87510 [Actinoplanes cyaneus]|uniref:Uncharacterized protein n=1 Tax=Actinoplanes cyaneus TaxID=52696 RepID=A0A919IZB4_9ACTN|nr:hypothetical protein [Actinoplanes cyaneus]GID70870.1 hypothetical protein Acy02nite_87510 [Actinoplanes cyaneus]
MLAAGVLGLAALLGIAVAPTLLLVGAGWILAMLGWATVSQLILSIQADRIPEEQRGKISGFTGLSGQIGGGCSPSSERCSSSSVQSSKLSPTRSPCCSSARC